jgi:hypothetical protein
MSKGGFGSGMWCVVGDFNAVCRPEERRGVREMSNLNVEMREFGGFLEGLDMLDLPLLGRRFTWYNANGIAMSRIDRGLVSWEWEDLWGACSLWVCPRDVSDHCPVVLKYGNDDWVPKPFRFNNYWLEHRNFKTVVDEWWRGQEVEGWMAFVLKEKLRGLKFCLKEWHSSEFGSLETRIVKVVEDILALDLRGENVGLSNIEVSRRKKLFIEFWELQKSKEVSLFQRLRSKWLRFGDANSKFFHGCVTARSKRNTISALRVGDFWFEKPSQIREAVENFFVNHFSASNSIRPNLDGVPFPELILEDNISLTAPFSLEEIHNVVKESDGNKSPGPDGFNFSFLKNCWEIIKGEIRIKFDQFHGIATLPKSLLPYFVALIPKVNSPFTLGDFRPISLLGCLYKLIAKVLAARLAKVMPSLVALNQSAFIKGRN